MVESWSHDPSALLSLVQGFLKEMGDSVTWDLKKFAAV